MIEGARPLEQAIQARIRNHPKRMKAREIERDYHNAVLDFVKACEDAPNLKAMNEAEKQYIAKLKGLIDVKNL